MVSPYVAQGTLNRALTSISIINFPQLNITAGFMGTQMAVISFEDRVTDYLPTTAGAVPSPRLVQFATIGVSLNKAQGLAALWEQQRLTNTLLGDVVAVGDSTVLQQYYLANTILENISSNSMNGQSTEYSLIIRGTYQINTSLFD